MKCFIMILVLTKFINKNCKKFQKGHPIKSQVKNKEKWRSLKNKSGTRGKDPCGVIRLT